MESIIYHIHLIYEEMRSRGMEPACIYAPASLASQVKTAVRRYGLPVGIVSVKPFAQFKGKESKFTYRTNKRDCAKRNK